jgi:hypothetical protein
MVWPFVIIAGPADRGDGRPCHPAEKGQLSVFANVRFSVALMGRRRLGELMTKDCLA